jgi:thiol:disulfide interchange protein DsbD
VFAGKVEQHLNFRQVSGVQNLAEALAQAKGKPVMLDFYADWCVSCKEMEAYTFPDPAVQAALKGFVLLQTDVTANTADDKALLKQFGLVGPPAMLFFDASGEERKNLRLVGYVPAAPFAAHVEKVGK